MAENSGIDKLPTAINSTKDDATGPQIASRPTDQDRESDVALRNANEALSIVQTAESAMEEATNILLRMRDLSLRAAKASMNPEERKAIQGEIGELAQELNRIADTTSFGGTRLLDGSFKDRTFQVGFSTVVVSLPNLKANFKRIGVQDIDASSVAGAQKATVIIDSALDYLHDERAELGAIENRLNHLMNRPQRNGSKQPDQASKSVLAQAKQTPSAALDLLT